MKADYYMIDVVFFTKQKNINVSGNYILGYINTRTHFTAFLPKFDILSKPYFRSDIRNSKVISYSKILSLFSISEHINIPKKDILPFAIEVDKKIWEFKPVEFRKYFINTHYPDFVDYFYNSGYNDKINSQYRYF